MGKRGHDDEDGVQQADEQWQRPRDRRRCLQATAGPGKEFNQDAIYHWRCLEVELQPLPGAIWRHQDEVTCSMRLILVDWLSQVCEHLQQPHDVIFLTVSYLDRFLVHSRVARSDFQLLGIACLWVAAKYEAVHPPRAKLLIKLTEDIYSLPQLHDMERKLLHALDYRLGAPTPLKFLEYYMPQACPVSPSVKQLAEQLLDMAIMVYPYNDDLVPVDLPPAATPHDGSGRSCMAVDDNDRPQDEGNKGDETISPQHAGSLSSDARTEVHQPTTPSPSAGPYPLCPSDSDDAEGTDGGADDDGGSSGVRARPSCDDTLLLPRSAQPCRAAASEAAAALKTSSSTPRQHAVDFLRIATALPSHLAAAAMCASLHAHELCFDDLLCLMAKFSDCEATQLLKLTKALTALKKELPLVTMPLRCTFVKRHEQAKVCLQRELGMLVKPTVC